MQPVAQTVPEIWSVGSKIHQGKKHVVLLPCVIV